MGTLPPETLESITAEVFASISRSADAFCVAVAAGFELVPHPLGTSPEWAGSSPRVVAFEPHREPEREAESVRRGLARGLLLRAQTPHGPADVAALADLLRG